MQESNLVLLTDEDLMALYQNGNDKAFAVLYKRHSGRVFDFLRRRTTPQNARELLQETFLKLHRSRHQYSAQYPFLPWLFAITRNALVDVSRLNESKIAKNSVTEITIRAPTIDSVVLPDLQPALAHLPESQRRAIELRYLQDWSFEKIAADMNTSPTNVRQLVSRGLKMLRSRLGGKFK
jgi:RNA polymerase sigma factor (sigma-70 family)